MSGTTFDRALELNPEIRTMNHSCGPGLTYQHLRSRLGEGANLEIELNRRCWHRRLTGK
jgi:hypothetical protein